MKLMNLLKLMKPVNTLMKVRQMLRKLLANRSTTRGSGEYADATAPNPNTPLLLRVTAVSTLWLAAAATAAAATAAAANVAGAAGTTTPVVNTADTGAFAAQTIHGPVSHVALVELYTSEGCSSCPPADHWLSALVQDKRLWRDIVPVAFHVDYWDQLGWRDRFSSAANTDRQRRLAAEGNANGIYTPGFYFDASEWRGFFRAAPLPATHIAAPGSLTISIGGDSAVVSYPQSAASSATPVTGRATQAHLALLGFGISTNVRNGENGGRTLHHDFVVLEKQQQSLSAGNAKFTLKLPATAAGAKRLALVSWVTQTGREQAIQSAGGWLTTPSVH